MGRMFCAYSSITVGRSPGEEEERDVGVGVGKRERGARDEDWKREEREKRGNKEARQFDVTRNKLQVLDA